MNSITLRVLFSNGVELGEMEGVGASWSFMDGGLGGEIFLFFCFEVFRFCFCFCFCFSLFDIGGLWGLLVCYDMMKGVGP